ncbi:MAG: DUF2461 domain-containing protein [Deltaproteobacteria bacterium]|jgi:uncharacterized protein (TIGR02453 family)|nr:DUF2461 domain-containing protein [Deltaproteobacteria bacterium]
MTVSDYFSVKTIKALTSLQRNNNRLWYQENKGLLDEFLFSPAKRMVIDVGQILSRHAEKLVADPKVDRSIYRLYRDTRFSKDKNPYKEHLGLIWWHDLPEGKLSSPCFYFHLSPEGFNWSVGCYTFTPWTLLAFRQTILEPESAKAFKTLAAQINKMDLDFNPPDLKRLPSGFSGPPWTSEWLRRKSIYTWSKTLPNSERTILGPNGATYLAKLFLESLPLYSFLVKLMETGRDLERDNPELMVPRAPMAHPVKKVQLQEDDF